MWTVLPWLVLFFNGCLDDEIAVCERVITCWVCFFFSLFTILRVWVGCSRVDLILGCVLVSFAGQGLFGFEIHFFLSLMSDVCSICEVRWVGCSLVWVGVTRVELVIIIVMAILIVFRSYKVALIMHTQALCFLLFFGHDCDIGFGVLYFVQEVCTLACYHVDIRMVSLALFDLLGHVCVVFADPSFDPQSLIWNSIGYFYGFMIWVWVEVIRVMMVGFMVIMLFFGLVMGYKVALFIHTLTHCFTFCFNYNHDLDLGIHLFVQVVCTNFCCQGVIREALFTHFDLFGRVFLAFTGPLFIPQNLFIILLATGSSFKIQNLLVKGISFEHTVSCSSMVICTYSFFSVWAGYCYYYGCYGDQLKHFNWYLISGIAVSDIFSAYWCCCRYLVLSKHYYPSMNFLKAVLFSSYCFISEEGVYSCNRRWSNNCYWICWFGYCYCFILLLLFCSVLNMAQQLLLLWFWSACLLLSGGSGLFFNEDQLMQQKGVSMVLVLIFVSCCCSLLLAAVTILRAVAVTELSSSNCYAFYGNLCYMLLLLTGSAACSWVLLLLS